VNFLHRSDRGREERDPEEAHPELGYFAIVSSSAAGWPKSCWAVHRAPETRPGYSKSKLTESRILRRTHLCKRTVDVKAACTGFHLFITAYDEFLRASLGGECAKKKILSPRIYAGYLARPVALRPVQNQAFMEDDRFKLSLFLRVGKTDRSSNKDGSGYRAKPPMKFRHLEYFVAAAEELNFTHAADRLNVSQPPFSKQIHDLEGELGIEFFERQRKGVTLTPAGKSF
jgi:hypothetical protein